MRRNHAAVLVNELIFVQDEHRLCKFLVTTLKRQSIVLGERAAISFSAAGA